MGIGDPENPGGVLAVSESIVVARAWYLLVLTKLVLLIPVVACRTDPVPVEVCHTSSVRLAVVVEEVLPWNRNPISHPGIKIKISLYYINLQYSVYCDNRFFGMYK